MLYKATITEIKKALKKNIPLFWICLWNQLLAIASWAKTYKLPFGHRGQNQPCKDLETWKCIVTSQNHSFAIDESSLPSTIKPWFQNLNDGTNEWIRYTRKNARSVQFHPESFPGPNDSVYLFENFIKSL
jgi:carbamoyl-phosphate synthase small subunit